MQKIIISSLLFILTIMCCFNCVNSDTYQTNLFKVIAKEMQASKNQQPNLQPSAEYCLWLCLSCILVFAIINLYQWFVNYTTSSRVNVGHNIETNPKNTWE